MSDDHFRVIRDDPYSVLVQLDGEYYTGTYVSHRYLWYREPVNSYFGDLLPDDHPTAVKLTNILRLIGYEPTVGLPF